MSMCLGWKYNVTVDFHQAGLEYKCLASVQHCPHAAAASWPPQGTLPENAVEMFALRPHNVWGFYTTLIKPQDFQAVIIWSFSV